MEDLTRDDLLNEALNHAREFLSHHASMVRMANESMARAAQPSASKSANEHRKARIKKLERTLRTHAHAKAYAERVILGLEAALADPDWTLAGSDMPAIDGLRDLLTHLESDAYAPMRSFRVNERINEMFGKKYSGSKRDAEIATAWNLRVRDALRALFAPTKG